MYNRKCSRCKEVTGTAYSGKKIQDLVVKPTFLEMNQW